MRSSEKSTNNNYIISLHYKASGQQNSPKKGLLVLPQCLDHRQCPVSRVALSGVINELDDDRVTKVQALELLLRWDDLFCLHACSRCRKRGEWLETSLRMTTVSLVQQNYSI